MRRYLFLLVAFLPAYSQSAGRFAVKFVASNTNAPVAGISAVLSPVLGTGGAASVYRFVSDDTGRFSGSVPNGKYSLCVDEALGFADPCQWSPIVIAIDASTPASVEVPLTKGFALTFKLIDNGVDLQRFSPAPPLSVVLTDSLGKDHLLPFVGNIENAAIYRLLTLPGEYQVA